MIAFINLSERRYQQERTRFLNRHVTLGQAALLGFTAGIALTTIVFVVCACITGS